MAASVDEVEVIIIKPDKMSNSWTGTLKICAMIVFVFALYTYLHIYIRGLIIKSKQLDRIGMLTVKADNMMEHIFVIDQNITMSLEELMDLE
ncbi:uncharacterized protein LOC125065793 [Vanessa atalanta]|uniref:uncharacterized protein LOC125065793 n=1 Tax=Vanessa atalanta TaxID=42275 RepID=UPI001FCD10DC|nr:uncharacterized protein LOC125065793 [Vanessa atalanta]